MQKSQPQPEALQHFTDGFNFIQHCPTLIAGRETLMAANPAAFVPINRSMFVLPSSNERAET